MSSCRARAGRDAALIVDEVFCDYPLGSCIGGAACAERRTGASSFRLGGLSKTVGLPQAKLGWIAIQGPDAAVAEALDRLELICDTYLSVSTPVQVAASGLLEKGSGRARTDSRAGPRATTRRWARWPASGGAALLPADGGWSAVIRVPATRTEEALVLELLERDRVVVHPGYFFDFPHEAFLVVSLLPEPERVRARASSGYWIASMPRDFFHGRHAGLLVPLFSIPSRSSWGIGEIGDLPRLGEWLADAGFSFVQLLPINEMADGQNSPYSAMSAMAIDPIFISPAAVPDIEALGGENLLTGGRTRSSSTAARGVAAASTTAPSGAIKIRALRAGFEHFRATEWEPNTRRAQRLKLFLDRARWWLDDYALFRALHAPRGRPLLARVARRRPGPPAVRRWLARAQELAPRDPLLLLPAVAGRRPVERSARCLRRWRVRRLPLHGQRRQRRRVGAPAGLPARRLGRRASGRVLRDGPGLGLPGLPLDVDRRRRFPLARRACAAQRRAVRRLPRRSPGRVLPDLRARDDRRGGLRAGRAARADAAGRARARGAERHRARGSSPRTSASFPISCARRSKRLEIPGYKVLRWERAWEEDGKPFKNPADYPAVSVATSGTHDTETVAEWWDEAPLEERPRRRVTRATGLSPGCDPEAPFNDGTARRDPARCSTRRRPRSSCCRSRRVRLARSGQHARADQRRELDLAAAVAGRGSAARAEGRERAAFTAALAAKYGR